MSVQPYTVYFTGSLAQVSSQLNRSTRHLCDSSAPEVHLAMHLSFFDIFLLPGFKLLHNPYFQFLELFLLCLTLLCRIG